MYKSQGKIHVKLCHICRGPKIVLQLHMNVDVSKHTIQKIDVIAMLPMLTTID